MEKEKIVSVLRSYLSNTDTDFGLMLTGAWGSGKTYFIKNEIKPIAEALGKKFLYLSVYGVTKREDLERSLFLAAYPLLKSGKLQALGALISVGLKYLKIDLDALLKVQASINQNVVLCVDDVERCEAETIPFILGILNSLVEHNQAKLILVCDEQKILGNDKYRTWKEKIIGTTILYNPTIEQQVDQVLRSERYKKHVSNIDASQIHAIFVQMATLGGSSNLRTLLKAFSTFSVLENALQDESGFNKKIASRLLKTVIALQIEFSVDAKSTNELRGLFHSSAFSAILLNHSDQFTIRKNFVEKYFGNDYSDLLNAQAIFDFIADGFLDKDSLIKYVQDITTPENGNTLERLLRDYRRFDDEALTSTINDVIGDLRNGRISDVDDLCNLSFLLFFLADKKVIKVEPHELRTSFVESFNKNILLSPNSSTENLYSLSSSALSGEHGEVLRLLQQKWSSQEEDRFRLIKEAALAHIDTDTETFCMQLHAIGSPLFTRPIFRTEDWGPVSRKIESIVFESASPIPKIAQITLAFSMRYRSAELKKLFISEKGFLKELAEHLHRKFLSSKQSGNTLDIERLLFPDQAISSQSPLPKDQSSQISQVQEAIKELSIVLLSTYAAM